MPDRGFPVRPPLEAHGRLSTSAVAVLVALGGIILLLSRVAASV